MSTTRTLPGRRTVIGLALALTALSGCKNDNTNPGGIAVTLPGGQSVTIQQGQSGTVSVTVARTGSFGGAVNLTLENAPSGLTGSFAPATVPGGSTTSTLTLAADPALAVGTYPVTVRAKGSGVADATTQLSVVITAASTGSFTLSVAPASVSVAQGGTGSVTVTGARTAPFTGDIALAVTGAPTGVTVTATPATLTGSNLTSTINVAVGASVAPGTYTITVTGTGTGVTQQTATFTLTVTQAAVGSFALSLNPTSLNLAQGASGTSTATIARTAPFTGDVTLAVTGAPSGMTVTVNPATLTGSNVTSTITVAAGTAAAGTYQLTVTATPPQGSGVAPQTATLAVTVTAPSTHTVTFTYCASNAPLWAAVQDGTGPWTQITPNSNNTVTIQFSSDRIGLASVTGTTGSSTDLSVIYITAAELQALGNAVNVQCGAPPTGKTVNGSVAGLGPTDFATIALGSASTSVTGVGPFTFQLKNVPNGTLDLIASRASLSGSSLQVNSLIIRRNLNPADGSTLPVLDFGSSEAFAPGTANVTINGLGTDQAAVATALVTANGSSTFFSFGSPSTATTQPYYGVPDAQLASGDLHQLYVAASPPGGGNSSRAEFLYFHSLADRTVTLGAPLSAPTITTLAATPYLRLRAVLPQQSDYNRFASVSYSQSNGGVSRTASVAMTAGYAGGGAYTLDIPDFSGVAGWNNAWGLQAGVSTNWSVAEIGGTFLFGFQAPTDGASFVEATLSGNIASP